MKYFGEKLNPVSMNISTRDWSGTKARATCKFRRARNGLEVEHAHKTLYLLSIGTVIFHGNHQSLISKDECQRYYLNKASEEVQASIPQLARC